MLTDIEMMSQQLSGLTEWSDIPVADTQVVVNWSTLPNFPSLYENGCLKALFVKCDIVETSVSKTAFRFTIQDSEGSTFWFFLSPNCVRTIQGSVQASMPCILKIRKLGTSFRTRYEIEVEDSE